MIYHCNGGLTITSPIVSCEMEAGFQRRQAELSCHYSHFRWKHMFTGRITWTTCLATTHLQDLVHACLQRSMPNLCRQCTFHLKCMATCCDSCLASRWGLEGHRLLSGVLFIDVSLSSNYAEIFRIVRFNCVCHLELQNLKASWLFWHHVFLFMNNIWIWLYTTHLPAASLWISWTAGLVRPVTGSPAVRSFLDDASSSIFIVIILRQFRRPVFGWRLCGCYHHQHQQYVHEHEQGHQNEQQQQQQQENISNHNQAPLH